MTVAFLGESLSSLCRRHDVLPLSSQGLCKFHVTEVQNNDQEESQLHCMNC